MDGTSAWLNLHRARLAQPEALSLVADQDRPGRPALAALWHLADFDADAGESVVHFDIERSSSRSSAPSACHLEITAL